MRVVVNDFLHKRCGLTCPRSLRLRGAKTIQSVFATAKKRYQTYSSFTISTSGLNNPRLAIMISRKQMARAVDRNRVRRILRESYRHQQAHLAGFDIIISVRKAALGLTSEELRRWIDQQWPQLITWYKRSC